MNNAREIFTADRRLTILQLLDQEHPHEVPARLVRDGVAAINAAHDVGLDQIWKDFDWLEQMRLVNQRIDEDRVYAKTTDRGRDAAKGRIRVDGVAIPD